MRSILKTGILVAMLAAMPLAVQAGTVEGAALSAGVGPAGEVIGAPILVEYREHDHYRHHRRHCWINQYGRRHCEWR